MSTKAELRLLTMGISSLFTISPKEIILTMLPPDFDYEITWHDAIKNIEKLVDEKRLELMKDQDFHNAHLLDKYLNVIKRGY